MPAWIWVRGGFEVCACGGYLVGCCFLLLPHEMETILCIMKPVMLSYARAVVVLQGLLLLLLSLPCLAEDMDL